MELLRICTVRHASALSVLLGIFTTSGCRDDQPFDLAPVRGTVKYEDGSLIPAEHMRVIFDPQGMEQVGKVAPAAAQAHVDVNDGTFKQLTTWKYGDGVVVGRHKVRVISMSIDANGAMEPTTAVPSVYHRADTTPLGVEVVRGSNNHFNLQIAKGEGK